MSSTIASSIFRKFSACRCSLDWNGMAPIFGDALDDVGHLRPEAFGDDLDGGERVLDHVVEEPCGDRDNVELQVRQEVGHLERMNHVRLTGMPDLALVLESGEDVRPAQQLEIGIRAVRANLLKEILEANHGARCLNLCGDGTVSS